MVMTDGLTKLTLVMVLVTLMAGLFVIGILKLSVASGASFEEAVTVLSSDPPASSSACVKLCVAEQVIFAPTSSVVDGQLISLLSLSSLRLIPVRVMLPVFVTK